MALRWAVEIWLATHHMGLAHMGLQLHLVWLDFSALVIAVLTLPQFWKCWRLSRLGLLHG